MWRLRKRKDLQPKADLALQIHERQDGQPSLAEPQPRLCCFRFVNRTKQQISCRRCALYVTRPRLRLPGLNAASVNLRVCTHGCPSQIEAELTSLCQTILAASPGMLAVRDRSAPCSEALLTDKLIPGATTAEAKAQRRSCLHAASAAAADDA